MTLISDSSALHDDAVTADPGQRRQISRRGLERRYFAAPVRFMTVDRREHVGTLIDISAHGALMESAFIPYKGETIVAYIDHIGRFEGDVVRRGEKTFAIHMELSPAKRERLKHAIDRFFQTRIPKPQWSGRRATKSDRRQTPRQPIPGGRELTAYVDGNIAFRCKVVNMSLTGIEILTTAVLELGQDIRVGRFHGHVVRQMKSGYAIAAHVE
ncbi:MAG: PilZ domain-containing protein [Pseudomonadota bacterium]